MVSTNYEEIEENRFLIGRDEDHYLDKLGQEVLLKVVDKVNGKRSNLLKK